MNAFEHMSELYTLARAAMEQRDEAIEAMKRANENCAGFKAVAEKAQEMLRKHLEECHS
jgi:hypothetical protein